MLTDEQMRQFREDGYLVFAALIQGERLACYKQVFDELVAEGCKLTEEAPHWTLELDERGEPRAGLLHKIQGVCVVDARVLELAREPAILDRVAVLIGENVDVFGTKFFPKLPNGGTSTGWHQDNFYFGTDTDRIISCGFISKIQMWRMGVCGWCLAVTGWARLSSTAEIQARMAVGHRSMNRGVDLVIPAGTVVLFSANLLHGSYDNHSNRTRYSTAWHYLPEEFNSEKFPKGIYEDRHVACKH